MTRLSLENRHFFSTKNNEIYLFPTAPDCLLTVHDKLSSEILKCLPKCFGYFMAKTCLVSGWTESKK